MNSPSFGDTRPEFEGAPESSKLGGLSSSTKDSRKQIESLVVESNLVGEQIRKKDRQSEETS